MAEAPWKSKSEPKYVRQERRTAKKPGAKAQINSGRTWSSLRDVALKTPLGRLLIDNKTTDADSYTITKKDWRALKRDSNRTPPGCSPGLQVDIGEIKLLVVEDEWMDDLLEYVRELEARLEDAS